jgi:hypothetical protein
VKNGIAGTLNVLGNDCSANDIDGKYIERGGCLERLISSGHSKLISQCDL